MNPAVKRLVSELETRPPAEQETWAQRWLETLHEDDALEASLETASDPLSRMALEALRDDRAGRTRPIEELCADEVASQ